MTPRPGRIARDLQIDIPRPRSWNAVHESAAFQQYVREVREIFEAQGVLVAH
jgi:NitT/TauT family transport system ATP-binding protein